jgi:hypothetical protein
MVTKIFVITFLIVNAFGFKECNNNSDGKMRTVVGIAKYFKHAAYVQTKTETYYLVGIEEWDLKFLEKKVKVTRKLYIQDEIISAKSDSISAIPQHHYGPKKMIVHPKWSLVD